MAQKFYDGKVLTMVATAVVAVGAVIEFEDTIGIAQKNAEIGEILTIDTEGVYGIAGENTTVFNVGDRVEYAGGEIVTSTGSGLNAGTVWEYRGAITGDVLVKING